MVSMTSTTQEQWPHRQPAAGGQPPSTAGRKLMRGTAQKTVTRARNFLRFMKNFA